MLHRTVLAAAVFLGSTVLLATPATPKKPAGKPAATVWSQTNFSAAVCGYAPPVPVVFSFPPGFVPRDPKHGTKVGCFWATPDDLDRALRDPRGAHFEEVAHGVFWFRVPGNMKFDHATGKFPDEKKIIENFVASGATEPRIAHRTFAGKYPALILTGGAAAGTHVYMLYLSHGDDDAVVIVNYRPPTSETPASEAMWTRFLDSIQAAKP